MTDDSTLLHQYVDERSDASFTELVHRHLNLVYGAALRQVGGDPHRADDVTQIVFTLLARKARSLTGRPVLAGWLYTAARLTAQQTMRTERRRQIREQEAHIMHELCTPETTSAEWERLRPVIDDAMAELSERNREALLMRFFQDWKFSAIAATMRLSEDAARMRVERALARLHRLLVRRGITSTAGALAAALTAHAAGAAPIGIAAKVTGFVLERAAVDSGGGYPSILVHATKFVAAAAAAVAIVVIGFHQTRAGRDADASLASARNRDRAVELEQNARTEGGLLPSVPEASPVAPQTRWNRTWSHRPPSSEATFPPETMARAAAALPLGDATHVAFVIDTSDSMRDPSTKALKLPILEQFWAILAVHPGVEFIQLLDADGRFVLGQTGEWIPNNTATYEAVSRLLARYSVFSTSSPATGMTRAMVTLQDPTDSTMNMSIVVLGGEFSAVEASDQPAINWRNPNVTNDGRSMTTKADAVSINPVASWMNPAVRTDPRRVSVSAIGFPFRSPDAAARSSRIMQRITAAHGGVFVPLE